MTSFLSRLCKVCVLCHDDTEVIQLAYCSLMIGQRFPQVPGCKMLLAEGLLCVWWAKLPVDKCALASTFRLHKTSNQKWGPDSSRVSLEHTSLCLEWPQFSGYVRVFPSQLWASDSLAFSAKLFKQLIVCLNCYLSLHCVIDYFSLFSTDALRERAFAMRKWAGCCPILGSCLPSL